MMHPSILFEDASLGYVTLASEEFVCPLCPKFLTKNESVIQRHLKNHAENAVHFHEKKICRCNMPCRDKGHFHCPFCDTTIIRKDFVSPHVSDCFKRCVVVVPPHHQSSPPHQSSPSSSENLIAQSLEHSYALALSATTTEEVSPVFKEADMPGRRQVMTRPRHSEHVLQQLNNQREWGFLCDCSVAVGDVDFRAHKAVLAACSSYFRMMFIKDQRARLDLSNMPVSAECFDLILQLMYLGRTLTEPGDFEELKVAMAYLQMYYIPDSPEDLKGSQSANANIPPPPSSSSSTSCSSSSSSSPSLGPAEAKMMFGVRLYEQPRRGSAEGERLVQRALAPAPVLLGPAPVLQNVGRPPAEEAMAAAPLAPKPAPAPPLLAPADGATTERPCDLRKRPPGRRAPARERPRFGRTFTCDDCGFVFSCEKLLVEHGLTCTNRKAFQTPEARAHGTPAWGEASAYEGSEGDDWRVPVRGPDTLADMPIRSVGTDTGSGPARNGGVAIKVELEEISTMDGVTAVRVGDFGEDGGLLSPQRTDEKDQCPFGRGDEEPGTEDDEGAFEGPAPIKREEPGSACEPCELCGAPLEEEDRCAHYISCHLPHICACGRCGQVFVRGRQLQEHAERCGETRDAATAESPAEADGQGWSWGSGGEEEEGDPPESGGASVRCPHCSLSMESEEAAANHAARCPEREVVAAAATGRAVRAYRQRPGAGSHRKGLYQHGGPPEPRYSRRLLRDRQLRPRGRDASRYCSPAASAPGTPPSGTTTCAT